MSIVRWGRSRPLMAATPICRTGPGDPIAPEQDAEQP